MTHPNQPTTKERMTKLLSSLIETSYALDRHPKLTEAYLDYLIERASKLLREKQQNDYHD